jgi:hypothetical protein
MDKNTLVNEQAESGERLISALAADGFETRVAFWATPTEEGKWFLDLASPMVDDKGPAAAYRFVHSTLRNTPDVWIEPLDIRVVGLNDSLTEAALAAIKPTVPASPYAGRNPMPYPRMTWFHGERLAGTSIDGACIYAPLTLGAPA